MNSTFPLVLQPTAGRKIKIILSAIVTGGLAAILILMGFDKLSTQPGMALIVLLMGAGLGLLCLFSLLSGFHSRLILNAEGLILQSPLKQLSCRWREVDSDFRPTVVQAGTHARVTLVRWNLKPGAERLSAWRKLSRVMGEASISPIYGGLNAEQLSALLNRVRDDQLRAAG